jgi:hypothetical protein
MYNRLSFDIDILQRAYGLSAPGWNDSFCIRCEPAVVFAQTRSFGATGNEYGIYCEADYS